MCVRNVLVLARARVYVCVWANWIRTYKFKVNAQKKRQLTTANSSSKIGWSSLGQSINSRVQQSLFSSVFFSFFRLSSSFFPFHSIKLNSNWVYRESNFRNCQHFFCHVISSVVIQKWTNTVHVSCRQCLCVSMVCWVLIGCILNHQIQLIRAFRPSAKVHTAYSTHRTQKKKIKCEANNDVFAAVQNIWIGSHYIWLVR